jgi:outer membrane lipoprotein-sorting protein
MSEKGDFMAIFLLIAELLLCAGCHTGAGGGAVPTYTGMTAQRAVSTLAARAQAVHTVSAHAKLTLVNAAGDSVRLDAAVAMQRPGNLRLRAWKFGQAVFDLTMNRQGLWIMTGQAPNDPKRAENSRLSAAQLGRGWALFNGDLFSQEDLIALDNGGPTFQIQGSGEGDTKLLCTIDRTTLTPRRYELFNDDTARFTLELNRYESFGDVVWPTRIRGTSPTGTFTVELDDVQVNQPLAEGTFTPPPSAERQQ